MGHLKISRLFFLFSLFCIQTSIFAAPSDQAQKVCSSQNIAISHYNILVAKGVFTIKPTRAPFSSGIWISGSCKALKAIKIQTNGNQLTIASPSPKLSSTNDQASAVSIEVPVGNIPSLTVTLEGKAEFIMGNIGLKKLNIQTKDESHAQVTASNWLNMIALNHSSIYFTGRPKHVDAQSYDQSTLVSLLPPEYY